MKDREPSFMAAIARTGGGKTYKNLEEMLEVHCGNRANGVPPRKILVIDNNNEYGNDNPDVKAILGSRGIRIKAIHYRQTPIFNRQRAIEICRVIPVERDGRIMKGKPFGDALNFALENFNSGLLVAEDFKAMTGDHLNDQLISSLVTRRHADVDTLVSLQGLKMIQPKLMNVLKWIRLHRVTGSISPSDEKFDSYIDMIGIGRQLVDEKFKLGGNFRFYHVYLDLERHVIRGAYTKADMEQAVSRYVADNWSQTAGRKMHHLDMNTGKSKYPNKLAALKATMGEYIEDYSQYSPRNQK